MIENDTFRGLTCKEKGRFAVKFRCKTCGTVTWVKGENMNIRTATIKDLEAGCLWMVLMFGIVPYANSG